MADKEQVDQLMDLGNKVARSTIAVVDAITQRGGFKGEELSTIGTLRDQAVQMVQAVETMQADAEFEDDEEEEAAQTFTFGLICGIIIFCYGAFVNV